MFFKKEGGLNQGKRERKVFPVSRECELLQGKGVKEVFLMSKKCLFLDPIKPLENWKRTFIALYSSFQTSRNNVELGNIWKENIQCNNERFCRDFYFTEYL